MDLNFETLKKLNLQYPNNQDFAEVVRKMVWKKKTKLKKYKKKIKVKLFLNHLMEVKLYIKENLVTIIKEKNYENGKFI